MMGKIIFVMIVVGLVMSGLFYAFRAKWYLKNKKWQPDNNLVSTLTKCGDSALQSGDVPVAALLLYDDQVIGQGYNTVLRNNDAGGHAELNALTDAMRRVGYDSFMRLPRTRLRLVATWEPCAMCKGGIATYGISRVVVMHPKPMSGQLTEWKKEMSYEWNKRQAAVDTLQEYLFRKHPLYRSQIRQ